MKILMSLDVSSLIQALNKSKLIVECPHCGDEFTMMSKQKKLILRRKVYRRGKQDQN
jgi:hypothetical protein